jgi:hypothetical protein
VQSVIYYLPSTIIYLTSYNIILYTRISNEALTYECIREIRGRKEGRKEGKQGRNERRKGRKESNKERKKE